MFADISWASFAISCCIVALLCIWEVVKRNDDQ
jgi:hypothetical protein